jgi:hypothetical protein
MLGAAVSLEVADAMMMARLDDLNENEADAGANRLDLRWRPLRRRHPATRLVGEQLC